jgi:hypothetical protein
LWQKNNGKRATENRRRRRGECEEEEKGDFQVKKPKTTKHILLICLLPEVINHKYCGLCIENLMKK